ncbi:hypothetical protein [Actinoplanes couchii]|uniref:PknH-like extracellular domain-containing protein n=1 Tax=Actinoplanes couchii TaxID=403638 RepID=A0ABQ3XKF9_9ACTN|nr:hypothetical protein [Actinoplanes couchii]MDR6320582.1 hypothetical protein [Actinoplanes couchii]GID58985.1 hypothetical protein Aco03nite_073890 [Actinoplanes couchii]
MRFAVGAGLLTVSLAGCASGAGNTASSGSVPSPVSASAESESSTAAVSGIPAEALLQPDDTRGATAEPLEKGDFPHVRPLRPCGTDPYPSDGTRTDAVAMRYTVPGSEQGSTPSTVVEFVGRHEAGGAAAQFTEISAALEKCPGGLGKDQHQWTVIESDDDSVLVKIEQRFSYADEAPATVAQYAALSKVNDTVLVVTDLGWENMDGSEKLVRDLIEKAEKRAATIK